MDEVREDERHGGIRSKPNEELFALDFTVTPEDFNDAIPAQTTVTPTRATRSKSGPLVRTEDLTCFRILKPHTAVPDPVVKRNPINKRGQRKTDMMAKKDSLRQIRKKITTVEVPEKCKDPWAMEEPKTILDSEWIDPSIKRLNFRQKTRKRQHQVTSELPAIETPHPGFSYNPSFEDHQRLLKDAVTIATRSNRREQRLNKIIAPTICHTVDKIESESEEDTAELLEDIKPNVVPKTKLKTKQQKRKEREEKEKLRLIRDKKQDNARLNEVFRIKSIQKSINKTEKKQKERLAKVVAKKIAREKFGQKKISKHQYEELSLDPALSEEIKGSLVGIPSHNRLTLERFNSLQKRNILEPRVKQRMQRKLRVKKFQKAIDKMDWEKTGYWKGIKVVR